MGMKAYRRGKGNVRKGAAEWLTRDVDSDRVMQLRAVDVVCAWFPEGADRDTVLAALFQPPQHHVVGTKAQADEAKRGVAGVVS